MKKEKNEKRFLFHAAVGLVWMLLCCVGGTIETKAATGSIWHDTTCECRSRGSQTVLPGSVHKFYVEIRNDDQKIVDESEIKVNWNYALDHSYGDGVEIVKTEGTTAWVKLQEKGSDMDSWANFGVFVEYSGFQGGHKDTVDGGVYLDTHYRISDDFYIIPVPKNVVIISGETKQLSLMARHYTSGHSEGEDIDITQYARWRAQNKDFFTVSANGTVTAIKSGYNKAILDAEKIQEALPEEWYFPNLVNNVRSGCAIFVLRSGEVFSDLAKVTLTGNVDTEEYVYFKPSYAKTYRLYGSDPEKANDEYMAELFELDSDQGYEAYITEEPVAGKVYLLSIPNRASSMDEVVTIRPVHEHEPGPGVIVEAPTVTERGLKRYYCIHCGILIKWEHLKKLDSENPSGDVPFLNGTGNDTKILELPDAIYDVIPSESGQTALSYRAPKTTASSITIPNTVWFDGKTCRVTGISEKAFQGNRNVKKVKIGSNVVSIGKRAFDGCGKLTAVSGGKNVVSIGESAFYGCRALKKVTIGAKVTKIGKKAFGGCKKLANITVKTTKLTKKNVGEKAFFGTPSKASVKVPKNKLKAYRKLFGSRGIQKKANIK